MGIPICVNCIDILVRSRYLFRMTYQERTKASIRVTEISTKLHSNYADLV